MTNEEIKNNLKKLENYFSDAIMSQGIPKSPECDGLSIVASLQNHFNELDPANPITQEDIDAWCAHPHSRFMYIGNGLTLIQFDGGQEFKWYIPFKIGHERYAIWMSPGRNPLYSLPSLARAQEWAKPYLEGKFKIEVQIGQNEWKEIEP